MKKPKKNLEESFNFKNYSIANNMVWFLKFFKKYEPVVLVCSGVQILLGTLMPLIGIYLPKLTIDLVTEGVSHERLLLLLGSFTLFMMAAYGINSAVANGKYHLYNTQRGHIEGLLFLKSLRVKYEYTELGEAKKAYWKAYEVSQWGDNSPSSRMITGGIDFITCVLCFLLYSTVLGTLSLWMVAGLIGLSFFNYLISISEIRYGEKIRGEQAQADKRYYCIKNSMGDTDAAKDIRIFGMNGWLTKLRDRSIEEKRILYRRISRKRELSEKAGFALAMIRDLGAYAFLLHEALGGNLTAGEFVLYFGAVTGFSGFVMNMMSNVATLRLAANNTNYLRAYMELPEEDLDGGSRHIDELTWPITIEFKDVSFSYGQAGESDEYGEGAENSKNMVFDGFNLTIRAGEKLALVGINGAGKTTLVKLLTGMYEPDGGQILLNGINRNEFPRRELYRLFSVVFQEKLILPFTVGENLAVDTEDRLDTKRAWEALDKAGLKTVFEEKKITMESFMRKVIMDSGVELSGGQEQRFLLARALYKDAPILVLDEPTAALDPIAESEVYDSYNKYSSGKTAIFISHRLASTRFSDRIVMIENGRILETGTHEELMEKGGAYADMFRVQSSYYKEEGREAV